MNTTATLIGTIGAGIILILFILNQTNKLKNDNLYYDLLNFIGSLLLIIYASMLYSWPFVVLNFIWAIFSLKDVITKFLKMKNIRLTV